MTDFSATTEIDEDRDVIVHYAYVRFVRDADVENIWSVFLGHTLKGHYTDRERAFRHARGLADGHRRPAWLRDGSGPPKPLPPV